MPRTTREDYEELVSGLKDGSHSFDERSVLGWAEIDVPDDAIRTEPAGNDPAIPHPYAGKHVVVIQYGGKVEGGGGLLREYAYPPEDIAAPKPEEETALAEATAAANSEADDKENDAAEEAEAAPRHASPRTKKADA